MPQLSSTTRESRHSVAIWGLAIRLFHVLLILAIVGLWYTVEIGTGLDFPMVWHGRLGYCVLGLVVFRGVWGIIGIGHARFANFLVSPRATWRYATAFMTRQAPRYAGHNPLGGWMSVLLLCVLFIQGVSGLFTSDDILFEGPLYGAVSSPVADFLAWLHHHNITLLWWLIGFHVAAVGLHAWRGEWLFAAMIHGRKTFDGKEPVENLSESTKIRVRPCDQAAPARSEDDLVESQAPSVQGRQWAALGMAIIIAGIVVMAGWQLH